MPCKKGDLYIKEYKKESGVVVSGHCIKDTGKPGRGPKILPPMQKGDLKRFGYSSKEKKEDREKSLNKAVKEYGKNDVIRKLNAVHILTRNTNPKVSAIFHSDMKYVQKKF